MGNRVWITSSWGDNVQEAEGDYRGDRIDALMAKIRAAGADTVLWRVDGAGQAFYHSDVMPRADGTGDSPDRRGPIRDGMAACDPLRQATDSAHRYGLKLMAWTCLFDSKIVRPKRDVNKGDPFLGEHPEWWLQSRDGKSRLEGVPCYAYDGVVKYRLRQYEELLGEYGVDGLHLSTRSHAIANPGVVDVSDGYGYNEPWVQEFKARYQGLDPREGLPTRYHEEKWIELRGECITDFLSQARGLADAHNAALSIDLCWKEDQLVGSVEKGRPRILCRRNWPLWVSRGLIDYLVIVMDRRAISDVGFLSYYRPHFADANAGLAVWFNLVVREYDEAMRTVTRLATPEEIGQMRQAIRDGPEIACFHESADIEFKAPDETAYWGAVSP